MWRSRRTSAPAAVMRRVDQNVERLRNDGGRSRKQRGCTLGEPEITNRACIPCGQVVNLDLEVHENLEERGGRIQTRTRPRSGRIRHSPRQKPRSRAALTRAHASSKISRRSVCRQARRPALRSDHATRSATRDARSSLRECDSYQSVWNVCKEESPSDRPVAVVVTALPVWCAPCRQRRARHRRSDH